MNLTENPRTSQGQNHTLLYSLFSTKFTNEDTENEYHAVLKNS